VTKRKLLVTSALPYANGSIHIGHLVEYVQTDVWVRFQKMIGNTCHYMCASDTHGTPIMINAKKQGVSPEVLVETFRAEHQEDFKKFHINFDYYGSTNSDSNRCLSEAFYEAAKAKGGIAIRDIEQLYSDVDAMFLPDRFVKGTCPTCKEKEQYGDSCEKCGATYGPQDLIDPRSVVSGDIPVIKESEHHFFKLSEFESVIKDWLDTGAVRDEVRKKLGEWFEQGLKDWDISRDEPYFGFKIPGTDNKYFYVWLDAPVGYISSTLDWCKDAALTDEIWKGDDWEVHHFIGKDILYFHCLFWPAMLAAADYAMPTKVNIHGFLTVNGEKMSKIRGTFIMAKTYLEHIDPEFLRYYYISKLSSHIEDIDLNLEDFVFKVNSDVLGKFINIGSRLGSIIYKKCDASLTRSDAEGMALLDELLAEAENVKGLYEALEYSKCMKLVMSLADKVNKYIDAQTPWAVVKDDVGAAASVCTTGLNAFRIIATYLSPVLPRITQDVATFLSLESLEWADLAAHLNEHNIQKYEHIAKRLELDDVQRIILG
jgi:methionyl-tRNA synthetase